MTKMEIVTPRLRWFTEQMERKLAVPKNQDKSDWRELTFAELFEGLKGEVKELHDELANIASADVQGTNHAIDEAADVANRAMMIADLCFVLFLKVKGSEKEMPEEEYIARSKAREIVDDLLGTRSHEIVSTIDRMKWIQMVTEHLMGKGTG